MFYWKKEFCRKEFTCVLRNSVIKSRMVRENAWRESVTLSRFVIPGDIIFFHFPA